MPVSPPQAGLCQPLLFSWPRAVRCRTGRTVPFLRRLRVAPASLFPLRAASGRGNTGWRRERN